ncbi:hypothetical protein ABGV42_00315 [Paenibacillus pabuli]|uniref:hypothetical protein n=1 Tax=Paenibacillus pabuli TaxID=1472 RepID=UPI003241D6C9
MNDVLFWANRTLESDAKKLMFTGDANAVTVLPFLYEIVKRDRRILAIGEDIYNLTYSIWDMSIALKSGYTYESINAKITKDQEYIDNNDLLDIVEEYDYLLIQSDALTPQLAEFVSSYAGDVVIILLQHFNQGYFLPDYYVYSTYSGGGKIINCNINDILSFNLIHENNLLAYADLEDN